MASPNKVITGDPDVLGGTPVFRGTRIPVRWLFDYLEANQTLNKFLDAYPVVTRAEAVHALETAKSLLLAAIATKGEVPEGGLGAKIASLFPKHGPDFEIPELRFTMQDPFKSSTKKAAGLRPADSRGRLSPQKASRSSRKKRA